MMSDGGDFSSKSFLTDIDKSNLTLKINFTRSWETSVFVNNEQLLDLKNMADGSEKDQLLQIIGSNKAEVERAERDGDLSYNKKTMADSNLTSFFFLDSSF